MGIVIQSSETAFSQSPETIYDFVSNPRNWPLTYPGSTGIEGVSDVLQVGDTWSETAVLDEIDCRFDFRLITAVRPVKWVFQSIGKVAQSPDGSGGFEGLISGAYDFASPGEGVTLFRRTATFEVAKHVRIPRGIVLAWEPAFIDMYHDAIATLLD